MVYQGGIALKKKYGQHFLRDETVIAHMIGRIALDQASVFEIGGGAGVLTRAILAQPVDRLLVFEIDADWAKSLSALRDARLTVYNQDFLCVDFSLFSTHKPWVLLANLPYQVTFPIVYLLQRNRDFLREGVIMVQEEVAQKIVKTSGRGYGFNSLFLQHFFEWQLLEKVSPRAFYPAPKVFSRLLYFKPRAVVAPIKDEEKFWAFIKTCFRQPRRTLRNNLIQTDYAIDAIDERMLGLRAQQLSMKDFLMLWERIR